MTDPGSHDDAYTDFAPDKFSERCLLKFNDMGTEKVDDTVMIDTHQIIRLSVTLWTCLFLVLVI